jgi:hypothetical protein
MRRIQVDTVHRKRVQKRLFITILLFYWLREYSYYLLEPEFLNF